MSQKKRGDKNSKWLRLAVGATLLAGASGAVVPSVVGANDITVTDKISFWSGLCRTDNPGAGGSDWKVPWEKSYNKVTFNGFEVDATNEFCGVAGSDVENDDGEAITGNTLIITNSTLNGKVAGGYTTGAQLISGNVVTIGEGTKVAAGGYLQVFGGISKSNSTNFENNTVNILTAISLDALKGAEDASNNTKGTNNTLNIAAKGVSAKWFGSFENVNFFLPSDIKKDDTMLTVTNGEWGTDLSNVKVGVAAQSGVNLEQGNTVNLIVNEKGISNAPEQVSEIAEKDIKMVAPNNLLSDKEYTFGLGLNEEQTALTATVTNVKEITGESEEPGDTPGSAGNDDELSGNDDNHDSGNSSKDVKEESPQDSSKEPAQDNNNDKEQPVNQNTGVEKLEKELTDAGIPAENIHEYHENVAGALDPNQGDSVAEKGVILTGGIIDGDVYAGHSTAAQGKAEKNAVVMTGGTINGTLYGGHSDNGESANNSVELAGGTVKQIIGGGSNVGDNNKVTISAGDVKENVYGGNAVESASGNTVTMTGGTVGKNVYGGYTTGENGEANKNTVKITGGTVSGDIYGGVSEKGTASGNTVTVTSGAQLKSGWLKIIGGYSNLKNAEIANNTINLIDFDGLNAGNIQGGSVEYPDANESSGTGYSGVFKDNTINFVNSKNISAHYFSGFSTANFYLPKDIANGDTVLTVSDGDVNLDGMNVGVAAPYGLDTLKEQDSVTLIKTGTDKLKGTPTQVEASTDTTKVTFLAPENLVTDKEYNFSLSTTSDALVATLDSVGEAKNIPGTNSKDAEVIKKSERLKSLVETPALNLALLNSGADLMTGNGFTQAKVAAEKSEDGKYSPFAALGGSSLREKSGSYVDVKGHGVNVGFAREVKKGNKTYLLAPVVEYGKGNYDSYQNSGIKGSGKSSFCGAGILARQTNSRGVYYEGSLRAGRVSSDYSGQLSAVTHASYDSDSNYWAGHLGWGRVSELNKNNSIDNYVKYFYSHQDGDEVNVKINGGAIIDQIKFGASESQRLRLGTRLTHKVSENNRVYGGVAYQLETKGEARATYKGNETATPSLKGSSVMMELGWQIKPGKSPVAIDLGVTGWAGKQRGVVGNVGFKYNF